ncbi:dimethylarginine dimethylaminohydrolase family protein [Candidatus Bipolaricaulota bacterium]
MVQYAITRRISASLGRCELTHQARVPIDLAFALQQHAEYERCLERLGCTLIRLPKEPEFPDAVFVEDTAVVLDEIALLTRPGAASRRPEIESIATALQPFRRICRIESPGTLDGGDVLVVGHDIYVGLSSRTNQHAVDQVKQRLTPYGYQIHGIQVIGCLHLKSAVTAISESTLLVNANWIDSNLFDRYQLVEVHPNEACGANGLRIGEVVVYPLAFPRTADRLDKRGIRVELVDLSELAKAEGAVTCCSLVFTHDETV